MTRTIIIEDERGRQHSSESELPILIGTGPDAGIKLTAEVVSGHGEHALAFIGLAEGHPFLQPAPGTTSVKRNGDSVLESQWLLNGDAVVIGRATIHCEIDDQRWRFEVIDAGTAAQLKPPAAPPPRHDAEPAQSPATPVPVPQHRPRRKSGKLRLALLAVFAVLVVGLAFVFLAVPVSVKIEPAPETMSISGVLPGVYLKGRRLMMPARYHVIATRFGYHRLETTIDVEWGVTQSFEFELHKLPGRISFTTSPSGGVSIDIDGQPAGSSPFDEMELEAGTHTLSAQAERYLPYATSFEVEGLGRAQTIALELKPAWAQLSFGSTPAGANVLIAGEPVGVTPFNTDVLEGQYQVDVVKDGYEPAHSEIEVIADVAQVVPTFELEEAKGVLELSSRPTGATVTVDGEFLGSTPLALRLEPHTPHTLKLSKPGYREGSRSIELTAGEAASMEVTLAAEMGVVFVTSSPADAELAVDGRSLGRATRRLELSTVAHRIEVTREGYAPFSTTVTPRAGISQSLEVVLQTTAAAALDTLTTAEGQVLKLFKGARFQMGASRRDQGRRSNETQREVELTRPFYLGLHEVTNDEYQRFDRSHRTGLVQGFSLGGSNQPVAMVSWDDAARYLNWLSERDGLPPAYEASGETMVPIRPATTGYRLPTEAEWSFVARYAARPASIKYPWGERFPPVTPATGNYADASASGVLANVISVYDDGFPVSSPVGAFTPTGAGVFDLGGNVAEWCHDYYAVHTGATALERDPVGPAQGKHHVVRGSSWRHSSISALRFTYRDYGNKPRMDLGFRIARYLE